MNRHHRAPPNDGNWPRTLTYWRKLPAEAFEAELREEVFSCVGQITSTIDEWNAAIAGDAAAAVGIALKLKMPDRIGVRVDMIMTLPLRCAFEDAGAALVLAHRLQQMPLHPNDRGRLSASWLVHNLCLAGRSRRRSAVRSNFLQPRHGR